LLSEEPGYGYSLHKGLQDFRFGETDRPTTYRALAQLERDGLVASLTESGAGQSRRVYTITPLGEQVLRNWMTVVKEEHDCLGRVVRRYQATGTADAVLAEVQGGWAGDLGCGWSPVVPSSPASHGAPRLDLDQLAPEADVFDVNGDRDDDTTSLFSPVTRVGAEYVERRYEVIPDRSVVLIEARSTVGPLSFGAAGLVGTMRAVVDGLALSPGTRPSAHVEVAVDGLTSGNSVYDAELRRRIDARRFPTATLDLRQCSVGNGRDQYRLVGALTFHGVTRPIEGTVSASIDPSGKLVVTGQQAIDIRDFDIPCPTVLMLRFYPDVRVHLHVEADPVEEAG
jgi:DNA-binding PadR family transcriptional regulator